MSFVDRFLREFVAETVLVDRDQREAARRERVAKHRVDPRADPRRAARHLAQHEVAGFGVLQLLDRELAPLALVDRGQPEALAIAPDHAEHQLGRLGELLQRMGEPPLPLLFGPAQHPVTDPQRTLAPALDELQPRRRSLGVP